MTERDMDVTRYGKLPFGSMLEQVAILAVSFMLVMGMMGVCYYVMQYGGGAK